MQSILPEALPSLPDPLNPADALAQTCKDLGLAHHPVNHHQTNPTPTPTPYMKVQHPPNQQRF